MQATSSRFEIGCRAHHADADGGCRDHLDVHAVVGQHPKHLGGDARAGLHAGTNKADLGDACVVVHAHRTDLGCNTRNDLLGDGHVGLRHREADVGGSLFRGVLHDHVDVHVGVSERLKQRR